MRSLALFSLLALTLSACGGEDAAEPDSVVDTTTGDDDAVVSANFFGLDNAYARAAPAGGTSAVYLDLVNDTADDVTLLAASTDAAGLVEIHQTATDEGGLSAMTPVEGGLDVAAGETVSLEPGGLHIMLLDLQRGLAEGDTVTLELQFEGRDALTVQVPVRGLDG
jgi:copper(I)-binding protein